MTIRTIPTRAALLLLTLAIAGCATHYTPAIVNSPYGIVSGVWHGMVSPFALVANLISWLAGLVGLSVWDSIQIIGRPNTGSPYYVGFAVGVVAYIAIVVVD